MPHVVVVQASGAMDLHLKISVEKVRSTATMAQYHLATTMLSKAH
jgi:hypothetical protein